MSKNIPFPWLTREMKVSQVQLEAVQYNLMVHKCHSAGAENPQNPLEFAHFGLDHIYGADWSTYTSTPKKACIQKILANYPALEELQDSDTALWFWFTCSTGMRSLTLCNTEWSISAIANPVFSLSAKRPRSREVSPWLISSYRKSTSTKKRKRYSSIPDNRAMTLPQGSTIIASP